jgi:tetratricopeptide (TPR) repeat protein
MGRALELDPLSPNKLNALAATLYRAGRYDEALEHFREVPDPDANGRRTTLIPDRARLTLRRITRCLANGARHLNGWTEPFASETDS